MERRAVIAGAITNVIFWGIVALAVVTGGWFMVALAIAAVVALLFLLGAGSAR